MFCFIRPIFLFLILASAPLLAESHPTEKEFVMDLEAWEEDCIYDIISALSELSMPTLLLHSVHYNQLGDRVRHVHPLKFIAYIINNSYLKYCMTNIHSNVIKWSCFSSEWAQKMSSELHARRLAPLLPGFCEVTNSEFTILEDLMKKEEWSAFLQVAFQINSNPLQNRFSSGRIDL